MQANVMLITMPNDALTQAGIYRGDVLMVAPGPDVSDGDLVAARLPGDEDDSQPIVARFFREAGGILLKPENERFIPARAPAVTIVGRVVGVMRMGIF